jgi:hypothetical protein
MSKDTLPSKIKTMKTEFINKENQIVAVPNALDKNPDTENEYEIIVLKDRVNYINQVLDTFAPGENKFNNAFFQSFSHFKQLAKNRLKELGHEA